MGKSVRTDSAMYPKAVTVAAEGAGDDAAGVLSSAVVQSLGSGRGGSLYDSVSMRGLRASTWRDAVRMNPRCCASAFARGHGWARNSQQVHATWSAGYQDRHRHDCRCTIISAASTKNKDKHRDPDMHRRRRVTMVLRHESTLVWTVRQAHHAVVAPKCTTRCAAELCTGRRSVCAATRPIRGRVR